MFKQLFRRCTEIFAIAGILTALLLPGVASAQTLTATFTYQGQLRNSGSTVNSDCDFQFTLWHLPVRSDTTDQVGGVVSLTLHVNDGLFTAQLNSGNEFGSAAFTGDERWLQTAVRCPAGSGDYTTLAPRQELTATPYALSLKPGAQVIGAEKLGLTVTTSSDSDNGNAAIYGRQGEGNGGPRFSGAGVWGDSNHRIGVAGTSNDAIGLYGYSNSEIGVFGVTYGPTQPAIEGRHDTASGVGAGVNGVTESTDQNAVGVQGVVESSTAGDYSAGVYGVNNSTTAQGIGVWGEQKGSGWGVYGWVPQGRGIFGDTYSGAGVYGRAEKFDGTGVVAENAAVEGTALRINTGAIRVTNAGFNSNTPLFRIQAPSKGTIVALGFGNPYSDNDPNALLFVTPLMGVNGVDGLPCANAPLPAVAASFNPTTNQWSLVTLDGTSPIPPAACFNVMVIKP